MKTTICRLCLFGIFLIGCNSKKENEKISKLEDRILQLEYVTQHSTRDSTDRPNYKWVNIGKCGYYKIINDRFKVILVSVDYQTNGIVLNGTVGNLTSFNMNRLNVIGAIFDSTKKNHVVNGFVLINELEAGETQNFSLFIPTKLTDIKEIGFRIDNIRM